MKKAILALAFLAAATTSAAAPASRTASARLWASVATLPNLWEGTWQGDTDLYGFPGPIAYTPAAGAYVRAYKPVDDMQFANCKQPGMPFAFRIAAMPLKFYYSPSEKMVSIYIEGSSMTRFIHLDGRGHSEHVNPTYLGESIGRWEGDTLVVDSIGFVKETQLQIGQTEPPPGSRGRPIPILAQHGPNLRIVERMRMLDHDTLQITTTLYDDTIFAKPYTYSDKWYRHTGRRSEPQEWVCSDNRDFFDAATGKLEYDVKDKAVSH